MSEFIQLILSNDHIYSGPLSLSPIVVGNLIALVAIEVKLRAAPAVLCLAILVAVAAVVITVVAAVSPGVKLE